MTRLESPPTLVGMGPKSETEVTAVRFLPARATMASLREAARDCRGCPLYQDATQTVFGAGSRHARVILVGEQPGNDEDLQGRPFVGPAGRVLDEALVAAGIVRDETYVTNVVKHFKFTMKGKRRMHKKPGAREIAACLPWLEKEIEVVQPDVLVCLGATAAQALLGRDFSVTREHGRVLSTSLAPHALATAHPSAVLRQRGRDQRQRALAQMIEDLKAVPRLLAGAR